MVSLPLPGAPGLSSLPGPVCRNTEELQGEGEGAKLGKYCLKVSVRESPNIQKHKHGPKRSSIHLILQF